MIFRRCRRAVALAFALLRCVVHLGLTRLRGPLTPIRRALWLQSASRRVLASLDIACRVTGHPARSGLVVSNHLSYLDIAIYSAAMPCVFVSKAEVRRWPYFGMAARAGGTIFVDRSSHASAVAVVGQMGERLKLPIPVLLFPEGTSSDGSGVLRFHSTLFQAAAASSAPVTAASVRYVIDDGTPERELCWFGDATFLGHMWKALGTPGFHTEVTFGEARIYADRRAAAKATRAEVCELRASASCADRLAPVSVL